MQDVAILHDIVLAFEPNLPPSRAPASPLQRDIIVIGDRLGTDEALLEIRVDDAGRLRRARAAGDRPGRASFGPTVK